MDAHTAEAVKWQVSLVLSVWDGKVRKPPSRYGYLGQIRARKTMAMSNAPAPDDKIECLGELAEIENCDCEYGDIANIRCYSEIESTLSEASEKLRRDGWKVTGWTTK